jgi:hypothetical protein
MYFLIKNMRIFALCKDAQCKTYGNMKHLTRNKKIDLCDLVKSAILLELIKATMTQSWRRIFLYH